MSLNTVHSIKRNMKIIANFRDILKDYDGNGVVQFVVNNIRHAEMLKGLDKSKEYSLEIKEVKSKRTIQQNRYMWLLLHEIDVAMNGKPTDEMDAYIMCLELANAKFDYIGCLPEAEQALKENFRAVKFIKKIDLNGKEGNMYKVFIGSSKMDVKEMNLLIDTILDVAEQLGIETDYWKRMLR